MIDNHITMKPLLLILLLLFPPPILTAETELSDIPVYPGSVLKAENPDVNEQDDPTGRHSYHYEVKTHVTKVYKWFKTYFKKHKFDITLDKLYKEKTQAPYIWMILHASGPNYTIKIYLFQNNGQTAYTIRISQNTLDKNVSVHKDPELI